MVRSKTQSKSSAKSTAGKGSARSARGAAKAAPGKGATPGKARTWPKAASGRVTARDATRARPAKPPISKVAKAGKAIAKAGKAIAKAGKPVAKAGKAIAKASKAVAKAGKPVAKASKAVAKASKAVAKAGKPVAKAGRAVAKAGKAVAKAGKAVAKAGTPVAKATASTAAVVARGGARRVAGAAPVGARGKAPPAQPVLPAVSLTPPPVKRARRAAALPASPHRQARATEPKVKAGGRPAPGAGQLELMGQRESSTQLELPVVAPGATSPSLAAEQPGADALAPFRLIETSPGSHSLLLTQFAPADAVFLAAGIEAAGYAWEGVARHVLDAVAPHLQGRLGLDPESSMFCAYGRDRPALVELGLHLARLFQDHGALAAIIEQVGAANFD